MLPISTHPGRHIDPPIRRSRCRWRHSTILICLVAALVVLSHPLFFSLPYLPDLAGVRRRLALSRAVSRPQGDSSGTLSLLAAWCDARDKEATGWAGLSDEECTLRFAKKQNTILQRIQAGNGSATLVFHHVHKAGGTTICNMARENMVAEDVPLPFKKDWTTNCVPYEAFLGPHPAVGGGIDPAGDNPTAGASRQAQTNQTTTAAAVWTRGRRKLHAAWLGGACFFGWLAPPQLRALHVHYQPLTFVASEGPLPELIPLDVDFAMVTMLRHPLDRVISSYKWWKFMLEAMPYSPNECRAYWAPANATLEQWVTEYYPDNWMTRELAGAEALYRRDERGRPGALTPADLERAKKRMHYFAAVLVMERWEDSAALLAERFGWEDVDYTKHRAGSREGSSAASELAAEKHTHTLEILKQRYAYDTELYRYGLELHERQVQEMRRGRPATTYPT